MAQRAIREYDGKKMMSDLMGGYCGGKVAVSGKFVKVNSETDLKKLTKKYPWLAKEKLVAKPDQLIKRRGKSKLILLNAPFKEVAAWINQRMNKEIKVQEVKGKLDNFIIEPFLPHDESEEQYVCVQSVVGGDEILFYHQGGVNVGDVDAKAERLFIPMGEKIASDEIEKKLLKNVPENLKKIIASFISGLFGFYVDLNYAYIEINPFVIKDGKVCPLDMAAKIDDTGEFESAVKWGNIDFPPPFGRTLGKEEAFIKELDSKTGASLKLTILNPEGKVWTLVAGGGASVIYADTISDLGYGAELANYGEYSGNPDAEFTYLYAKTVLDLMTRKKSSKGKILIIGGGIANFTDVAKTFKGIIKAIREYTPKLKAHKVKIYVRRGGPNYQEGLDAMENLGEEINLPIEVYGPQSHMTRIVSIALKGKK